MYFYMYYVMCIWTLMIIYCNNQASYQSRHQGITTETTVKGPEK